ncbi:MAG: GTPase HflX [Alistipes sp.]|nr:GTPase HflX [Alistipes sp.]
MAELHDNREIIENLILIGVSTGDNDDTEVSLKELGELVKTAGASTAAVVIQNRESVHPGTYIGKGKIEEVKELLYTTNATGVVCDDELSPAQLKNLEEELDTKVMDRTLVILDIFAKHASTSEGKIQVELAQLKYRMSRLAGLHRSLSRLGGGIGTRGPGEKKIEMDRRLIRDRIGQLNRELADVKAHREVLRAQRGRNPATVIAIVGYTNAGKSTLLNTLTGAGILAQDMLFATLDPTTRSMELDSGETVLLTDTVGFIRKLPHHLIDAFRSTLEEAKFSDMIIHVADASSPDMDAHMQVVYETLHQLGIEDKPIITLFNKMDVAEAGKTLKDLKADKTLQISAKTGMGTDDLKTVIEEFLREKKVYINKIYDYNEAGKIQTIRRYGQLLSEEYTGEGIAVTGYIPREMIDRV